VRSYLPERLALVLCLSVILGPAAWACSASPKAPASEPTSLEPAVDVISLSQAALPPLPRDWPTSLQLGLSDSPGGGASLRSSVPLGFRYQYLAGGVNTRSGWSTWEPDASFVKNYMTESEANGMVSVFTYYMLYQSSPGSTQPEAAGIKMNLDNTGTMTAYYNDLKLLFSKAGSVPSRSVLHVEPDLWGYINKRGAPSTVPAKVAATGLPELQNLPDNAEGFARAIVKLRDIYAPNMLLAYHLSMWGSGEDPLYSKPGRTHLDALAASAGRFYGALKADFDLVFTEFSDRDAGFKEFIGKDGGASWWKPEDFDRNVKFLRSFSQITNRRIVIWQIPFGNTRMTAMNNTWNHYQDNKVESLLDEPGRVHLHADVDSGVIALLFGRGADGATCACDAAKDGITNPTPINGNNAQSVSADDDGGFFRQQARRYYERGPIALRP
jgi:hypothetical protein